MYLALSIFCALFGAVYECFSHDVYSYHMIYAFGYPLCLGTLPCFSLCVTKRLRLPKRLSVNLYNAGVASLTIGSILKGIHDIYGTASTLVSIYYIVGIPLVVAALLIYAFSFFR